jgi:hypothetical protein
MNLLAKNNLIGVAIVLAAGIGVGLSNVGGGPSPRWRFTRRDSVRSETRHSPAIMASVSPASSRRMAISACAAVSNGGRPRC